MSCYATGSDARRRLRTAMVIVGIGIAMVSCATLQVQRPLHAPVFPAQEFQRQSRDGFDVGVRPLVTKDDYLRLFDDDLPKIGIVALYVEAGNSGAGRLEIRPSGWILRAGNRTFPAISVADVFKRYYSAHRIRMYSVATDGMARRDLERASLRDGPIEATGARSGFVFFQIAPGMAAGWERGATLVARSLRADRRAAITLEIALAHANS